MEEGIRDGKKKLQGNARKSIGKCFILVCAPLALAAGFIYIYTYYNSASGSRPAFPCLSIILVGLYCPGCGNTRALHALAHLDIVGALRYNLLLPFLLILLGWLLTGEYLKLLVGKRVLWLPKKFHIWWVWVALAVVFLFTVFRNIPYYPFSALAPG